MEFHGRARWTTRGGPSQSTLHDPSTRLLATNFLYPLTFAGEVEEAARGYEAAIALAQTHGDALTLAILYSSRASLRAQVGDLRGAEEDLQPIERLAFQDAAALQPFWRGYLAELLLERGELAEAQRLVEGRPAVAQQGHLLNFFRVRGLVAFHAGSPEQALTDLRAAGDRARSLRIENPAFAPWRSEAALALHRLGRPQEARELAHEELELSQRWGTARTIGISLRALGLVEGGRTGERRLREAVDVLAHSPARLEHARALVDLGAALRRGNSRSEAQAAAAPGNRARAPVRCKRAGEARQRGAGGDRRACAHDPAQRPRRADGERAAGRAHGGART